MQMYLGSILVCYARLRLRILVTHLAATLSEFVRPRQRTCGLENLCDSSSTEERGSWIVDRGELEDSVRSYENNGQRSSPCLRSVLTLVDAVTSKRIA